MTRLSAADRRQIQRHGLELDEVERQLGLFADPPLPTELDRPCITGDGIRRLEESEEESLLARSAEAIAAGRVSKFVPASGAASRMFRQLTQLHRGEADSAARAAGHHLLEDYDLFPFATELDETVRAAGGDPEAARQGNDLGPLLDALLTEEGLGYAKKPKALILFHRYGDTARTAAEEQLRETAEMAEDTDGLCRIHFTVPAVRRGETEAVLNETAQRLENELSVRFELTTSIQSPATDTLAADLRGQPFRDSDGRLVFRPGGHGALLTNLGGCGGDLVVIKNIDNILPEEGRRLVVRSKHLLLGHLLEIEEILHGILRDCDERPNGPWLEEALHRTAEILERPDALEPLDAEPAEQRRYLVDRLNRPLRLCGMVPASGETGGGPFWIREDDGSCSPQIVETSQIDLEDPDQKRIVKGATHFNPVDLVVSLRSYQGTPFDLDRFVDPRTVFIARKSHGGRPLLGLERPGLWNGAMARWNTLFVEVPAATFAPVKTVFDLLRPEHQPG